MRSFLAGAIDRHARQHAVIGARDDDVAAIGDAPGRDQVRQQLLHPLDVGEPVAPHRGQAIETFGEDVGERGEVALHRAALLPALVDHLNEGAEADRDEEGDDEGRDSAAQCRLGRQEPVIGRFRDRLRQSLDRIGLDARVRCMRARHALDPRSKLIFTRFGCSPRCIRIMII
ncbi:hypothetical protein AB7M49_005221 [Bradyrhizobium elkanii]